MTEVYEIIKQSLDNCTRMTEASKVDEATRVANKIVKLKDNPVPSIEKEVDEITLELANAKYYGASPDLCVRASNLIYELFEQNGVETNKEQPIKSKCVCKDPHYGFKTIDVCTDCNGIKDDAYWNRLMR